MWPTFLNHLKYLTTWHTHPPDIPTHLTYLPICPTHQPDLLTRPYNLPNQIDNHPEPACSFRILTKTYQAIPNHTMTTPTKFHNFHKILQFPQNVTMLTKFHTFYQILQNSPNFTISTKNHNFYQFRQYRKCRQCGQCRQCRLVQTIGTISTYNKAFLCPIGQFRNPCDVYWYLCLYLYWQS